MINIFSSPQRKKRRRARRRLFRKIFYHPFRRNRYHHIKTAMITGTKGKTTTTRMLAHIMKLAGETVGYNTTDGIVIDDNTIKKSDSSGYDSHARVLNDSSVTAAIMETARGGLIKFGLYTDRCDVAALINVGADHIGEDGIDSVEQMAKHKQQVINCATKRIVLNADDILCREMISDYPTELTTLFSFNSESSVVKQHLSSGGKAFCINNSDEPTILYLHTNRQKEIIKVSDIPASWNGVFKHNIANAMAAASLAEGLGVSLEVIAAGLGDFQPSIEQSPGRSNVIEKYLFKLVLDNAVQPPSARALMESLKQVNVDGKRVCALTTPGNREDAHYDDYAKELHKSFDKFIIFERDEWQRRRDPGEITKLLKASLLKQNIDSDRIYEVENYCEALELMSDIVMPGDLAVILGGPERGSISQVEKAFSKHEDANAVL